MFNIQNLITMEEYLKWQIEELRATVALQEKIIQQLVGEKRKELKLKRNKREKEKYI